MSVSASLPEWKQLLLDRKRKEEEEKERREREEEERLASMPAWKRGIIQRRRAKQEGGAGAWGAGGGERGREEGSLEHPQVGTATAEAESRVSMETIPPVRQNPFIRSQSGWRRGGGGGGGGGREGEGGGGEVVGVPVERGMKGRVREGERGKAEGTEQGNRRAQDGEHERDGETRDEKDMQERRDSREKKERGNGRERDTDSPRGRKEDEPKDGDPPFPLFPRPLVPHLRTIRAENIIIIEKEREERRERERERDERGGEGGAAQDDEKRGMRMDLREILAVGGSVTEIRASEVLIIKPVMEERSACREREASGPVWRDRDREKEWGRVREVETCVQRVAERERGGEVRGAGIVEEGRGPAETGGRVSQLLSKFGEHPKPPSRSKSTDCFVLRPPKDREGKEGGEEEEEEGRRRREENAGKGTGTAFRGVPKRSFSFSDRVIRDRENRRETQGCRGDGPGGRSPDDTVGGACGQTAANEESVGPREPMRAEPKILGDVKRGKERERETEEGFTVASVKNTEGIGFARRVQVRQEKGREGETPPWQREEKERERERWTVVRDRGTGSGMEAEREPHLGRKEDGGEDEPAHIHPYSSRSLEVERERGRDGETDRARERVRDRGRDSSADSSEGGGLSYAPALAPTIQHSVPQRLRDPTAGVILDQAGLGVQGSHSAVTEEPARDRGAKKKGEEEREGSGMTETHQTQLEEGEGCPEKKGCVPKTGCEIQIPRAHFYGVEMDVPPLFVMNEGGGGVERRESWRIGRPLTRIESLREKIRQRERQREKEKEGEGEAEEEGGRKAECSGKEREKEEGEREVPERRRGQNEGGGEMEEGMTATEGEKTEEGGEERRAGPACKGALHVTQEVGGLRLPVSQARLVSVSVEEEETDSALHSPRVFHPTPTPLLPGDGDDGQVEGPGACRCAQVRGELHREEGGGEGKAEDERSDGGESLSSLLTEEKELEPHYLPPSLSSSPTTSSLSLSPPLPPSLIDMSRIYTLAFGAGPVDSDANMEADRPKHRAETGPGEKGPETRPGPEIRGGGRREGADSGAGLGVGGMQRQLEQLRLKEQDSRRRPNPLPGSKATATDERPAVFSKGKDEAQGERKGAQGPPHSQKNPQPTEARTRKTTALASNQAPQRQQPLSNQTQLRQHSQSNQAPPTRSFTVTPRSGSSAVSTVESTPKNAPSPSPPLFTLRSASGGSGKRGTTITITPRKTTPAAAAPAPATKMAPSAHTPTPNGTGEGGKKRYPTAEEIQVIGGYESLEKSCLVKHRGKHRGVKVCFDEVQLEQVCEYPSESSMLACFPCSTPLSSERERDEREEDDEEEEEEEKATFMSGGSKKAGPKAGRALKVDESCRR